MPDRLVQVFEDGKRIGEAARLVRSAKGKAVHADRLDSVGGLLRRNPGLLPACDAAADGLAREQPYCVCPSCDGTMTAGCKDCRETGWLTFPEFDALTPTKKDEAKSHAPGDAWEGDDDPVPAKWPPPAFVRKGLGKDALGSKIPDRLRDYFADSFLASLAAEFDRHAASLESVTAWNPWLKAIHHDLRSHAEHLRGVRPYAVCTACHGKQGGCRNCATAGFLPAHQQHELSRPADKRAA